MIGEHGMPDDEALGAWLDGELNEDGAAEMAKLIASDEDLAMRAERIRHLDALLRQAVPEEEVPAALLERLGLAEAPASATVVDMVAVRQARAEAAAIPVQAVRPSNLLRLAAQVALVAGLGLAVLLWQSPGGDANKDAPYRTLSNAGKATPANGMVMFAPGTDAVTARSIARSAGATLVGGPNEAGAWKLDMPVGRRDTILASLRNDKRVTLAEAIDGHTP